MDHTKIELLLEHSLDFVIESSEEVSLCEAEGGEKDSSSTFLKLTGTFQKGNTPNGNKRIYKTELLAREVSRFQSRITSGLALGKVYHPGFFDKGGASGVTDVSHRITKLWMEGNTVKGELLVFKTSCGADVEAIVAGGGTIGLSSRGYGSMKRFDSVEIEGKKFKDVWLVDDNFRLETFDLVLTPSVKTAIMHPVKKESVTNTHESKHTDSCNENLKENANKEGGYKPMTLEELKAKYPELYNTVHEAGAAEGRRIGESDARAALVAEQTKVVEAKDAEIVTLTTNVKTVTTEKEELSTKNTELTGKVSALEADVAQVGIKNAVVEAISESEFKDHLGEEDIADICRVSSNVEEAKKETASRIKFIKKVIEKHSNKVPVGTGSQNIDTSESGSTNEGNSDQVSENFKAQQRSAAGI